VLEHVPTQVLVQVPTQVLVQVPIQMLVQVLVSVMELVREQEEVWGLELAMALE
jgi:hypothetical protein